MPREIITDWTTPAGAGFASVMYFDENVLASDQRTDLGVLWGAIDNTLDSNVLWAVRTTGRDLNSATGTLTGVWTDTSAVVGAGSVAGQVTPDAAQILLRWNGTNIVNGRFVRGHTFVPGLSTAGVNEGNLSSGSTSAIQAAIDNFLAAGNGFGVWHRPQGGSGGLLSNVEEGSVWSEFAVLRRRRG